MSSVSWTRERGGENPGHMPIVQWVVTGQVRGGRKGQNWFQTISRNLTHRMSGSVFRGNCDSVKIISRIGYRLVFGLEI